MCGICGVSFKSNEKKVDQSLLVRMNDTITHRGPDDQGAYADGNFGIGMRRLSIIDLSSGHQPQFNEDRSLAIVFNGEIYNYRELRDDLLVKGHKFQTDSDTESIIHAYEEYGVGCLKKLNGMFGFTIYDRKKKQLFIARDRVGIKPLYYYEDGQTFAFASEIKPILQIPGIDRSIDMEALNLFLTFEYIPSPYSIFKKVRKIPPGHFLIYRNQKIKIEKYWDVDFSRQPEQQSVSEEELRELMRDAVRLRLVSDVPLGAFLSGGIDSSTIVGLMAGLMDRPVKTFSIGFEDQSYNELNYARTIAKKFNTEHTEFIIQPDAIDLVEKLVYHLDEPLGDFSIFPTYLVSKMARDYVTVILSGDGGDELFAGYDTYIADKLANRFKKIPGFLRNGVIKPVVNLFPPQEQKKGIINKMRRFMEGMDYPEDLQHVRWMIFLSEVDRRMLFNEEVSRSVNGKETYEFIRQYFRQSQPVDRLNRQNFVDYKTYLVDNILVKVDRMSMATSLEARVPFLDHRVVEASFRIPGNLKIQGKDTKYILKQTMKDILPDEIIHRDKQGFSIPIKNWLREELRPMMQDVLHPDKLKQQGIFDSVFVNRLVGEHVRGTENHSHRLWALMMFELWYDQFAVN
ncbi:MAG TPA: asparagine synthase (glutamine-hydrolyzing) [Bacteroidetes bacterium]|nr:asparagine synthase (glutamine-hydrolyzing) [Bacteroidota bacterium]